MLALDDAHAAHHRAEETPAVLRDHRLPHAAPESRHERRDVAILAKRATVYAAARAANPRRWTGPTRNWTPIGDMVLNPIRDLSRTMPLASAAE